MSRFKKNRYYDGKLLTAEGFRTEQDYISEKTALTLALTLGGGIINGFSVSAAYPDALEISAGTGIDGKGRLLKLDRNHLLAVGTVYGYSESGDSKILKVYYTEKNADGGIEYIEETCGFTFGGDGIEIAEISFDNGEIKNIRDLRKINNSYLYKRLYKNLSLLIEKRLGEEQKRATEKLNGDFRQLKKYLEETTERLARNIITSGTVTVKQKKIIYTDEIFHRLQNKPSYVTFGIETKSWNAGLDSRIKEIIYGDGELFEEYRKHKPFAVKKAVRVFPERGSFILALKLARPVRGAEIKLRWFAFSAFEEEKN